MYYIKIILTVSFFNATKKSGNFSMTDIIDSLLSNNIMVIIGILLASLLVYSILKRLLKIIILFLIIMIVYTAYMVYNGQEVPGSPQKYIEESGEKIETLKKGGESLYRILDSIKNSNDIEKISEKEIQ